MTRATLMGSPRCKVAFEPEAVTDPYIGMTIAGDIVLTDVIGVGAMGRVYRARQQGIGRDVAVKILLRELSSNAQLVRRFEREAQIASKLCHPHVVEVHLAGQLPDGSLYMVMEYLDGVSLATALDAAGGVLPLERTLSIAIQMCDAVGEAHAQGIVHRDLKPENVMLVRRAEMEDWVKVLDFGIAKGNIGGSSMHSAMGHIFGTPRYMSPEGVNGTVGPASDVYALAIITYQMLSGRTPFDGDRAMDVLVKHVHDAPPDLRELQPARNVPESIARLIMENLAKDPALRSPNARAFGAALALATKTAGLVIEDVGAFTRMSRDSGPVSKDLRVQGSLSGTLAGTVEADVEPVRTSKPQRSRWLWLALTFLLGAALAAGTLAVEQHGDRDHRALVENVRKAIGDGHYVSPPGDNARDLLASGLKRWPGDATLSELRSDAERDLVTRSMAAHSGGDVEGAYETAQKALEIDPSNRSANLLSDEYGLELRSLTTDPAATTGAPSLMFDPPATGRTGTAIDLSARVVTRSAGAHAIVGSPKLTVREQRETVTGISLPLAGSAAGPFTSRLLLPATHTRIYLTFEATVDGNLLRAERSVDVQP